MIEQSLQIKLYDIWKQGYANYSKPSQNGNNNIEKQKTYIKTDKIPSFVIRIRWLASGFIVLFVAISLIVIYSLIKM